MLSRVLMVSLLIVLSHIVYASDINETCLLEKIKAAEDTVSIGDIREQCRNRQASELINPSKQGKAGSLSKRYLRERETQFDPFVITPHRMNYILPALMTDAINKDAYASRSGFEENLKDVEAKFQLSFKVPLNRDDIFTKNDAFYFGFTLDAWWQVYAENISKPFRETNYRPEFFYLRPFGWTPFGGNTGMAIGIEHESNGRSQPLSRSWNRVYAKFLFEKDNYAVSFQPWWRIPEDDKDFELDSDGDDNPDISDFMGHSQLNFAYKWNNYVFNMKGRRNFAENNGAVELGVTFPLWGKLRGYATFFNGYGESLIDYNYNQTRFGLGVALNDVL